MLDGGVQVDYPMNDVSSEHRVTTAEQLESLYGEIPRKSIVKEIDYISDHYRAFIEKSPFVVIGTSGPHGVDCSPRGDPPGFVRVQDEKTLMVPDRRGNNRVDSMHNLVHDPRISLLFLIPGVGETLRVSGRAAIVTDPELCASFKMQGKIPASVLIVTAERVYYQCQKALVRSRLWSTEAQIERSELPSPGQILEALSNKEIDGAEFDRTYPEHLKESIY